MSPIVLNVVRFLARIMYGYLRPEKVLSSYPEADNKAPEPGYIFVYGFQHRLMTKAVINKLKSEMGISHFQLIFNNWSNLTRG